MMDPPDINAGSTIAKRGTAQVQHRPTRGSKYAKSFRAPTRPKMLQIDPGLRGIDSARRVLSIPHTFVSQMFQNRFFRAFLHPLNASPPGGEGKFLRRSHFAPANFKHRSDTTEQEQEEPRKKQGTGTPSGMFKSPHAAWACAVLVRHFFLHVNFYIFCAPSCTIFSPSFFNFFPRTVSILISRSMAWVSRHFFPARFVIFFW